MSVLESIAKPSHTERIVLCDVIGTQRASFMKPVRVFHLMSLCRSDINNVLSIAFSITGTTNSSKFGYVFGNQ